MADTGLSNLFLGIKSFLDTFFQKSICFSYFVNAALMVRVTWVPINGA
jgi:high-affinity Fe2+/Pb2+ permease